MKRSLSVDVGAVDVDFVVVEQGDHVVDVAVLDRMEQDVAAHLFDPTYHFEFQL